MIGWQIDVFEALTIEMSKILHAPLKPAYYIVNNTDAGLISDMSAALSSDMCYATSDLYLMNPAREEAFDFACPTRQASELGTGIMGLIDTDLGGVFDVAGEGFSICVFPSSQQETAVLKYFGNATIVEVASIQEMMVGMCNGLCDAVVDDIVQGMDIFKREAACSGMELGDPSTVPALNSGGGGAAMTHRPYC